MPQGAFYAFPEVSALYQRKIAGQTVTNSFDLVNQLLEKAQVAFIPGAPFGSDEYIRISYATSMQNIEKGMTASRSFWAMDNAPERTGMVKEENLKPDEKIA